MITTWLDNPSHRAWLERNFADILQFALASPLAEGGFAYLGADSTPVPGRKPQLMFTARTLYTASLGVAHGIPGAGDLAEHALTSLDGLYADQRHGGWLSEPGTITRKATYDHVQVGLGAATAVLAGIDRAKPLLAQVISIIDERLWDSSTQTLRESFAEDWSDSEDYRGANANMHGIEAFIAIGKATQDPRWHERSLAVADRLINRHARAHDWLLPEHYTANWEELLDYNADEPNHPFRPYGATFGHSLEWARFLLELERSSQVSAPWLVEAAVGLTRRALDGGWALDGRPGLVYTVDWNGAPVSVSRLHWPICEGIQASAALVRVTGDAHWEDWYRRLWDHAARYFIDERGTWINELGEDLREGGLIWPGRPDVYHCGGACITPLDWI